MSSQTNAEMAAQRENIVVGVYLSDDYLVRTGKWSLVKLMDLFLEERLGNGVAFSAARPGENQFFGVFDTDNHYALEAVRLCKENGIRLLSVSTLLKPAIVRLLQEEYGELFLGSQALNERTTFLGGIWERMSKELTFLEGFEGQFPATPEPTKCTDFREARDAFVRWVKTMADDEKERGLRCVSSVDATPVFHLMYQAGVDLQGAEIMTHPVDPSLSALRGAAKVHGKDEFMVWPAMGWYGGSGFDPLKPARLKVALCLCFMHGATHIFNESDHFIPTIRLPKRYDEELCVSTRKVIRDFYSFTQTEHRPEGFPQVTTGFVQGYLDGWHGASGRGRLWGQEDWTTGNAEKSWDFLDIVFPNYSTFEDHPAGWFGGTPYGQVDLVPIETESEILSSYRLLVFLGWHTMTPEIYQRLLRYVDSGGCIFMSLAHTFTNTKHFEPGREALFNGGALSDLFGVEVSHIDAPDTSVALGLPYTKNPLQAISVVQRTRYAFEEGKQYFDRRVRHTRGIEMTITDAEVIAKGNTGQPVLITKSFPGGGEASLLLAHDYPIIYKQLVWDTLTAMIGYHQGDVRLKGSNAVNFAVYEDGGRDRAYLLNTDVEEEAECSLSIKGAEMPLSFSPGELKIVEHHQGELLLTNRGLP